MLRHRKKDIQLRKLFFSSEINNKVIKSICSNKLIKKYTFFFNTFINSKTKIINNCLITGRCRSVSRKLKISRMQIKKLYKFSKVSGLKNASW